MCSDGGASLGNANRRLHPPSSNSSIGARPHAPRRRHVFSRVLQVFWTMGVMSTPVIDSRSERTRPLHPLGIFLGSRHDAVIVVYFLVRGLLSRGHKLLRGIGKQ